MLNKIYIGFVLSHESTEEITAAPSEETTAAPPGKSPKVTEQEKTQSESVMIIVAFLA